MRGALLVAASLVASAASAAGTNTTMNVQQLYLFNHAYPGARVVFDCEGNFSGASGQEHVLGIERPGEKRQRIGLLLDSGKWLFHDIDKELSAGRQHGKHAEQGWEGPPQNSPFKCRADLQRDRDLSVQGKPLDGPPSFALRAGQASACFGTSGQYNNWDCVAYRSRRFQLWYQQEFAD